MRNHKFFSAFLMLTLMISTLAPQAIPTACAAGLPCWGDIAKRIVDAGLFLTGVVSSGAANPASPLPHEHEIISIRVRPERLPQLSRALNRQIGDMAQANQAIRQAGGTIFGTNLPGNPEYIDAQFSKSNYSDCPPPPPAVSGGDAANWPPVNPLTGLAWPISLAAAVLLGLLGLLSLGRRLAPTR